MAPSKFGLGPRLSSDGNGVKSAEGCEIVGFRCGRRTVRFARPTGEGINPPSTLRPIGPARSYRSVAIQTS